MMDRVANEAGSTHEQQFSCLLLCSNFAQAHSWFFPAKGVRRQGLTDHSGRGTAESAETVLQDPSSFLQDRIEPIRLSALQELHEEIKAASPKFVIQQRYANRRLGD